MSDPDPVAIGLTPSEELILECVRARMPDAEIAVRLGVPTGDAKERIAALVRKLGVMNRTALATWPDGAIAEPVDTRPSPEAASIAPSKGRRLIVQAVPALLAIAAVVATVSWTLVRQTAEDSDFRTVRMKLVETPAARTIDPAELARLVDSLRLSEALDPSALARARPDAIQFVVATPVRPTCLEFRSFPNAVEEDCLADGSRLRSLNEWRRVGLRIWEKVETPDGRVGWVDSRYLK